MRSATRGLIILALALLGAGPSTTSMLAQGIYRIEIVVERNEGPNWREIDPRLVLDRDDRLRFRLKSSFDGYLYVTYQSSSGKYDILFPGEGQKNRIQANKEYALPQSAGSFRIADPPGQEIVYFLLSATELLSPPKAGGSPAIGDRSRAISSTVPRCDDTALRANGSCIDVTAGPKPVNDPATLPSDWARIPNLRSRGLTLGVEQNTSIISSDESVTAPVVYEVRLSHR